MTDLQPFAATWAGVCAADFSLDEVRRRSYLLGRTFVERGWNCLVACDTRFMANLFAQEVAETLALAGATARVAPLPTPLPAVQQALDQGQFNCALVVSARNRPFWYNGLLLLLAPKMAALTMPSAAQLAALDLPPSTSFPANGAGAAAAQSAPPSEPPLDLRTPYLDLLRSLFDIELISRSGLTIFVDVMNGTTAGALPSMIVENGQTRAIEINRELDPLFGKVRPLPAESGLNRLRKLVRESDSHIGLAFSADGTALGAVNKNGEQLDLAELCLLLASYLARQHRQRGVVVLPPPAPGTALAALGPRLSSGEEICGLRVEVPAAPQARIAELLGQERPNLLLGCSTEGEIVLGRYGTFPDAMLAGLAAIEMVARNGGNLRGLIDGLREQIQKA